MSIWIEGDFLSLYAFYLYNPIPLYPPLLDRRGGRKGKRGFAPLKLTFSYLSFKGEGEEK